MDRARNEKERCEYRSPTGRRCRNRASIGWNVCNAHGDFHNAYARAAEIVSNHERLDTVEGIHAFLIRIARAAAANEIDPRQATLLTYIAQNMPISVRELRKERKRVFLSTEEDAWRMKALADSYHDNLHCEQTAEDDEEEDEGADEEQAGDESDRSAAAKTKAKSNSK